MFIATEVRESAIFGQGLFATAPAPRGAIVCCFAAGARIITEAEFLQGVRDNDALIVRTATRCAGRYYTIGNEHEPYTFINHSFEPNLLCCLGLVIALRDLNAGDELTLDYRTLIDDTDEGIYNDAATGEPIRGFTARDTLLRTARQLIEVIESTPANWEG